MKINDIIDGLDRFDDVICCSYEECPIYREDFCPCPDGEEVCLCFAEARKALRKLKYIEDNNLANM